MNARTAIALCVVAPVFGQIKSFDVASIKLSSPETAEVADTRPGGLVILRSISAVTLLQIAWGVKPFQIQGAPAWLADRYDVDAKIEGAGELTSAELREPMQALLKERFALQCYLESRPHTVYSIVVAKNGPRALHEKFSPADMSSSPSYSDTGGKITLHRKTMAQLAGILSYRSEIQGPVTDDTSLRGEYDLTINFLPDDGRLLSGEGPAPQMSVFTAVQDLGLKLVPKKGMMDVLVIQHVDRPTPN